MKFIKSERDLIISTLLGKFIDEKMTKFLKETRDINEKFNINYIKTAKGFNRLNIHGNKDNEFINSHGHKCFIHFNQRIKKIIISITIYGIPSTSLFGNIGMLYRCMDKINVLAEDVCKRKSEYELDLDAFIEAYNVRTHSKLPVEKI